VKNRGLLLAARRRSCGSPRDRGRNFEAELKSKVPVQVRRGEMMLKALDAGRNLDRLDYLLQAVRFGKR
jgi:hypothetical protein